MRTNMYWQHPISGVHTLARRLTMWKNGKTRFMAMNSNGANVPKNNLAHGLAHILMPHMKSLIAKTILISSHNIYTTLWKTSGEVWCMYRAPYIRHGV